MTDTSTIARPRLSDLLGLVAGGDRTAFSEMYASTSRHVLSVVRRQLVDLSLSEEVSQEVYLEIWQTAARYSPVRGSGIAWISVIARRRAIDRVRAVHASRSRDERAGRLEWAPSHDEVAENHEIAFDFRRATAAMHTLPAVQREAITLIYGSGLSSVEAAAELNISASTVRNRVRVGLMSLRASIA